MNIQNILYYEYVCVYKNIHFHSKNVQISKGKNVLKTLKNGSLGCSFYIMEMKNFLRTKYCYISYV